jgi:hypothetical protein
MAFSGDGANGPGAMQGLFGGPLSSYRLSLEGKRQPV